MEDDRIIWRASRTRVYAQSMENPWFRQGRQAREARAFLESLAPLADRQEEDEDTEVVARPRPVIRAAGPEPSVFDNGLLGACVDFSEIRGESLPIEGWWAPIPDEDYQMGQDRVPRYTREQLDAALEAYEWKFDLDDFDIFEMTAIFDATIKRDEAGHWYSPHRTVLLRDRLVESTKVAWLLEHGRVTSSMRLSQTCPAYWCISPHHHREKGKR